MQTFNLLYTWFDENLKWPDRIKQLVWTYINLAYTVKRHNVKKQLAQSLILSRLDYNNIVYHPLPAYQQKKLQRVQNSTASFVTNIYSTEKDVLKLGWLPINERVQFNPLKSSHQAMSIPCTLAKISPAKDA